MNPSPTTMYADVFLTNIKYLDGNIGDDTNFDITVNGHPTKVCKKVKCGQSKPIENTKVFSGNIPIGDRLSFNVAITEDDLIYDDTGSGDNSSPVITASMEPVPVSVPVSVKEKGALFGTATANFTLTFSIVPQALLPMNAYLIDAGNTGWIYAKATNSSNKIHLFYSEAVELLRIDMAQDRLCLKTLEGPDEYQGVECFLTLSKGALARFRSGFNYSGPINMTLQIKPKTGGQENDTGLLKVAGIGSSFEVVTYINSNGYKWENGRTYNLGLPDYPHDYAGHYAGHNQIWFKAREDGAYLHTGHATAGCITVVNDYRWNEIYRAAIKSRAGDKKHVGTVKVTIKE